MADDITLPALPAGYAPEVAAAMRNYARAAIAADRKRKQSEAEEVCAEAYQVVGSLLSDLGIFETEHAEKILDNLSQARRVHKDVLPWPSFDRQHRGVNSTHTLGEPVGYIMPTAIKQLKAGGNAIVGGMSQGFDVPIYAAPQPAEPSDPIKDMVEEDNKRAAEQACNVLALRLGYVWSGDDWVLHETAEPVKVPGDDQAQHEADRLEVFADSGELSDTLREMGAVARAKGRYMDAYYLDECAVHIKGLYQFAEGIVSARKS